MSDGYLLWGFILVAIAAVLFFIEVVVPSGGLIGISAAVVAIAGVVAFWLEDPVWGAVSTLGLLVVAPLAFHFAIKVMPNTPIGRAMILGSSDDEEEEYRRLQAEAAEREREQALVGVEGVATTDLRPVGAIRVDDAHLEALSEVGVIEAGTRVRITRVEGNQIKVRRA